VKPSPALILLNGRWAVVVVLFDHIMDKITRYAGMGGNGLGWTRINLGIVDDERNCSHLGGITL
jgi:hypothetical protein